MKNIKKILLFTLVTFVLTGCVSVKMNTEINSNKSFNFTYQIAIDTSAYENQEEITAAKNLFKLDEQSKKVFIDAGYSVFPYKDGTWEGNTMSKAFSNIDNVVSENEQFDVLAFVNAAVDNGMFTRKENIYKANWVFDFSKIEVREDTDQINEKFNMVYTVTLPEKSLSNNADTVSEDGKTLTWNIKFEDKRTVEYEFKFAESVSTQEKEEKSNNNVIYYVLGGGVLLVLLAVVVVFQKKKKTK